MPICSDDIDLTGTGERVIIDLAGQGMEPLMALGRYRYLRAQDPLPAQRHCSLVVRALPDRGTFTFEVDGRAHEISPGHVLCVPPGSAYVTGATAQQRGELTWLIARVGGDPQSALRRAVGLLRHPQVWSGRRPRRPRQLCGGPSSSPGDRRTGSRGRGCSTSSLRRSSTLRSP